MVSKKFQMPLSFSALIFRHTDRTGGIIAEGFNLQQAGNVNLLTAYYGSIQHLEALLSPFLDDKYYDKAADVQRKFPNLQSVYMDLEKNMKFFEGCKRWLRLLVLTAWEKDLLKTTTGSWDEISEVETSAD